MTIETHLEDLRTLLLEPAAVTPSARAGAAGRLLVALKSPRLTPAMAHAAREISEALSMASEHAEFLAERAGPIIADQPRR